MRLDFSSVSSKSASMWFELWDKMSIQQKNLFVNLSFKKVQPNPQLFTVQAALGTNTATNICCCLCCHRKVSTTTIAKIQLLIWKGAKTFIEGGG